MTIPRTGKSKTDFFPFRAVDLNSGELPGIYSRIGPDNSSRQTVALLFVVQPGHIGFLLAQNTESYV